MVLDIPFLEDVVRFTVRVTGPASRARRQRGPPSHRFALTVAPVIRTTPTRGFGPTESDSLTVDVSSRRFPGGAPDAREQIPNMGPGTPTVQHV